MSDRAKNTSPYNSGLIKKQTRVSECELLRHAREPYEKLYTRRLPNRYRDLRLIGVKFSGLVHGNFQLNLFEDTGEEVRLLEQLDRIRKRFGAKAIMKAREMVHKNL